MKYIYLVFIFSISCNTNSNKEFLPQVGDILFQDLDSSPLCEAIETVTPGFNGGNFSHIGIVTEVGNNNCINSDYLFEHHIRVTEAIPNFVTTSRLDSFLNQSLDNNAQPKVIVGRLKKEYSHLVQDAILFLKNKIGFEYDDEFLFNNNKYYCSELIYEAFAKDSIFELAPMTFIDPKTNKTMEVWEDYYLTKKMEIPEGKIGINPGLMSLSKKIEIIHIYGQPHKFKN